jgi:hypothetical protein
MKRILTFALIGAGLAASALADNGANARFRMKTGRDLPYVEEARARANALAEERAGGPSVVSKTILREGEQRFHAKTGRYTPAGEARLAALNPAAPPDRVMPARNDAEERFFAKTGRHTPQWEAAARAGRTADRALCPCCGQVDCDCCDELAKDIS